MKVRLFFIAALCFIPFLSFNQSLSAHFGGLPTQFKITANDVILNNQSQILVKRAVSYWDRYYDGNYGYGYESIHLEFISSYNMPADTIFKLWEKGRTENLLVFYDKEDKTLAEVEIENHKIKVYSDEQTPNPFFYSIDLINIPLVLLERTKRIDLSQKHFTRNTVK